MGELNRSITPPMLWAMGVGCAFAGLFFGWNLGLARGGTLGLGLALIVVTVLYLTFTLSYAELACAIPRAGGVMSYADRALGRSWGFWAGMAQNVELIFAPPAIAFAIGDYLHLFVPRLPLLSIAFGAYLLFTWLNIRGAHTAAIVELIVTSIAVLSLIIFCVVALPHLQLEHLTRDALPHGWQGAVAAIPFAVWCFLGIEAIANMAEETVNPQRTLPRVFVAAFLTLAVLAVLTFIGAAGVDGWQTIVFKLDGSVSDSPLPMALAKVMATHHPLYQFLFAAGLLGLVGSFHGLILASGRSTMEFGRMRHGPAFLAKLDSRHQTPANALKFNCALGLLALASGHTSDLILLSVFGALTLYILAMISLLVLRVKEPSLPRPFLTPCYPFFPWIALVLSLLTFLAILLSHRGLGSLYLALMVVSFLIHRRTAALPSSPPIR
jgi:ethanolamine permease